MPVRVSKYEFLFNNLVTKTFDSKELAYKHAFDKGYQAVEFLSIIFTNN
jgi:hypothetical protein